MAHTDTGEVLGCIRKHRERLDFEISAETGTPLAVVRELGAQLVATGAIIACEVTRYADGDRIQACLYRVSGYTPPPAPGRKARPAA
jgi:hypothetical protein